MLTEGSQESDKACLNQITKPASIKVYTIPDTWTLIFSLAEIAKLPVYSVSQPLRL